MSTPCCLANFMAASIHKGLAGAGALAACNGKEGGAEGGLRVRGACAV